MNRYLLTFKGDKKTDDYKKTMVGDDEYTLTREGECRNWHFRINGVLQGTDRYRNDLAERFNFELIY